MKSYVEFEVCNGAYEVSCPDARCRTGAALALDEISQLVDASVMEKHLKFRLNHGELRGCLGKRLRNPGVKVNVGLHLTKSNVHLNVVFGCQLVLVCSCPRL